MTEKEMLWRLMRVCIQVTKRTGVYCSVAKFQLETNDGEPDKNGEWLSCEFYIVPALLPPRIIPNALIEPIVLPVGKLDHEPYVWPDLVRRLLRIIEKQRPHWKQRAFQKP